MEKILLTSNHTKLSDAVQIAIGHRTISQFCYECKMPDTKLLVDLINKKNNTLPPREILRKIASASEGRITHTYLYELCGYSELDKEEDRSYATFYPKRGEIYYADLGYNQDAEQNGIRPVIVVQNNKGNENSPTVVVIPITSRVKRFGRTHVLLQGVLKEDSYALTEQIRVISKRRLFYNGFPWRVATLFESKMKEIQYALEVELGFIPLMFNEQKAFELIQHIKKLQNNIKVKNSKELVDVLNDKIIEFKNYCLKYNRNYKEVISEYNRLRFCPV